MQNSSKYRNGACGDSSFPRLYVEFTPQKMNGWRLEPENTGPVQSGRIM